MLKKRIIFSLLYSDKYFMLSRNFRLQKVGNLEWLMSNYDFLKITCAIDELIILNVNRDLSNHDEFCEILKKISKSCFIPIAAGGGIRKTYDAFNLLRSGADKIVVNSTLFENKNLISEISSEFGEQSIVASLDFKISQKGNYEIWSECGSKAIHGDPVSWINLLSEYSIGEFLLTSIDRDGTGQGYDLKILDLITSKQTKPIIISGGVGNAKHLLSGLLDNRVDAVATANLFNFVGDGLIKAREFILNSGVNLPVWNIELLKNKLRDS